MDIYLTEYGLTPESLDSFTRMFLFTNKDGVLGISVNQII